MATGGIFTLITNDGKQDRMLMATAFLSSRLASIRALRASNPATANDPTPTLLDIERTHVLFTNAHFKPFAAIGFEYNKVRTTSGTPALNNKVTFSIPQFGDFFHDMALHCTLAAPAITVTASGTQNYPAVRWCTYPGERLLKEVNFEVNGNPLDNYTSHAYCFHREFQVPPNKIVGYNRLVGQENPLQGYVDQPNWANNGVAAISFRYGQQVYIGAQTPKNVSDVTGLDLYVPLLFWFNRDVRLAVPSVAIPYGQRFINITLAGVEDLVDFVPRGTGTWSSPGATLVAPTISTLELYINNIFVNPDVHNIYIQRIGFSLIRVHREQTYQTTKSTDQVLLSNLKWPIEYLCVGMKLLDYFNSSTAATKRQNLQNWQLFCKVTDTTYNSTGQNVMRQKKSAGTAFSITNAGVCTGTDSAFTTEAAVGDLVMFVDTASAPDQYFVSMVSVITSATSITVNPIPYGGAYPVVFQVAYFYTIQGWQVTAQVPTKTVTTMSIQAHGINIYNDFPEEFYNSYTSYHYGGPNINTPEDIGAMLVPFCLYPGTYQPSGHINVSRAREFFLNYTSAVIDGSNTGLLVVLASAINFLLISDGSAILRYST